MTLVPVSGAIRHWMARLGQATTAGLLTAAPSVAEHPPGAVVEENAVGVRAIADGGEEVLDNTDQVRRRGAAARCSQPTRRIARTLLIPKGIHSEQKIR